MQLNNYSSNIVFRRQLINAQQKLMMPDVPMALKAISYIRICYSAMQKSHQLHKFLPPNDEFHLSNTQTPYLSFLERLAQEHSTWWTTCYVSQNNLLESKNSNIHQLLQPLNAFVQANLESTNANPSNTSNHRPCPDLQAANLPA